MSTVVLLLTHLMAALVGVLAGWAFALWRTSTTGKVSALWLHELRRNEDPS
jgi:hypothetical protein